MGALDGVTVLDLSRLLPGPAATAWLLGQGATVIRVESRGRGDPARHMPPFVGEVGAYFAATSIGKRSIAIDLRSDGGRALVRRLARAADVLVEGFRPGVMEQMGLGPDALCQEDPRLIYARLSGFGQTGPWRRRPGHDLNYVGLTGMIDAMARVGPGVALPGAQLADFMGAQVAASGIAAALFARERTGEGAVLDVSLTESALWALGPALASATASGHDPAPAAGPLSGGLAGYGTYRCADGRYLTVGALEPRFQAELEAQVADPSSAAALADAFAREPRDVWVARLSEACVGPVLAPREVPQHPIFAERGVFRQLGAASFVHPPLGTWPEGAAVPRLGEHTRAIARDLAGLSDAQIDALVDSGAIGA